MRVSWLLVATISLLIIFYYKAYGSSTTVITFTIEIQNCTKCGLCEAFADHSISIDGDGYPYWKDGVTIGNLRFLSDPNSAYVNDIDLALSSCPESCITKGTMTKKKLPVKD